MHRVMVWLVATPILLLLSTGCFEVAPEERGSEPEVSEGVSEVSEGETSEGPTDPGEMETSIEPETSETMEVQTEIEESEVTEDPEIIETTEDPVIVEVAETIEDPVIVEVPETTGDLVIVEVESLEPHVFTVAKYVGVLTGDMDESRVDRILAKMGAVLAKDAEGDVETGVTFQWDRSLGTFIVGDGEINSASDYAEVDILSPMVKVVKDINWCGCTDKLTPNTIGCATSKTSMIVQRTSFTADAVLWTHEFGHAAGLEHRDDALAVMYPSIKSSRVHVNEDEKKAFRDPTTLEINLICGDGTINPSAAVGPLEQRISELTDAIHVHGLPFREARGLGQAAVDSLIARLEAVRYRDETASNILLTLGAIGGSRARNALMEFIQTSRAHSRKRGIERRIRGHALMGLGFLVEVDGDAGALDFLRARSRPGGWPGGELEWTTGNPLDMANRLSRSAILGLALTGTATATALLEELADERGSGTQNPERHLRTIQSALAANAEIRARNGLLDYYSQ